MTTFQVQTGILNLECLNHHEFILELSTQNMFEKWYVKCINKKQDTDRRQNKTQYTEQRQTKYNTKVNWDSKANKTKCKVKDENEMGLFL
jgi:hypothetical protein